MKKQTLYSNLDKNQELFLRQKVLIGSAESTLRTYRKVFLNINSVVGRLDYDNQQNLELQVLTYFEDIFDKLNPVTYNIKRRHVIGHRS